MCSEINSHVKWTRFQVDSIKSWIKWTRTPLITEMIFSHCFQPTKQMNQENCNCTCRHRK